MQDRKFVLPVPETISISAEAVRKIINSGDGAAALTYLYILQNGGSISLSEAEEALGFRGDELDATMAALRGMGLVSSGGDREVPAPKSAAPQNLKAPNPLERDGPPEYAAADIERELKKKSSGFGFIITEIQRLLGKILASNDLTLIFGIYDYLGLPPEVILLLVNHCIEEYRAKNGEGRTPTVRYIEKKAYLWARLEIATLEQADEFLKKELERKTQMAEIKKALQIKNRDLTPTEEKYIASWLELGYDAEALSLAYDKTVVQTGSLVWKYMDKIVKSWHSKGLYTVNDIERGDGKKPTPKSAGLSGEKAPDSEDIERMKKYLSRIKGGKLE